MEHDNDKTIVNTSRIPLFGAAASDPTTSRAGMEYMGPSTNVLPTGSTIGEFEIVDLIGEGGFGIVYLALDHSLGRHVALKEYMPSGMASRTSTMHVTVKSQHHVDTFTAGLKSFINEARMLAQFDSRSLVKVYRFWEANGTAYMVMPFYAGITLKQALREQKIQPTEAWIKHMLSDLFDAVDTIHRVQCFHRDIAPDNILILEEDGRPLLLDFGAARRVIGDRTQGPTVILKPGFAPIEQYADVGGFRQGAWTDIYAIGAVMYFLITGKAPPPAVARVLNDEMVPAMQIGKDRYSPAFLAAIDRALAIRPDQRLQSLAEFRQALGLPESSARSVPFGHPASQTTHDPRYGQPHHQGYAHTSPAEPYLYPPPGGVHHRVIFEDDANQPPSKSKSAVLITLGMLACAGVAGALYVSFMPDQSATTVASAPLESRDVLPQSEVLAQADEQTGSSALPEPVPVPVPEPDPVAPNASSSSTAAMQDTPAPAADSRSSGISGSSGDMTEEPGNEGAPRAKEAPLKKAPLLAMPARPSIEEELWRIASASNKPSAYETYLHEYPKGRYASAAKAKLALSKSKEPAAKASASTDIPDSPVPAPQKAAGPAKPANATAPSVAAAAPPSGVATGAAPSSPPPALSNPEEELWKLALNTNNANAFENYLNKYPDGKNASTAREKLASFKPAEKPAPSIVPDLQSDDPVLAPKPQSPGDAGATKEEPKQATSGNKKTIEFSDLVMVGDFTPDPVTGAVSGTGKISWKNGDQFEGRLVKGLKQGKGRFTWNNGIRYSGDWVNDVASGKGTISFPNGDRYEGEVKNGKPDGQGIMKFKNGDAHQGGWAMGKTNGHGRYTWASGGAWEGEFIHGERTKNGQHTSPQISATTQENAQP